MLRLMRRGSRWVMWLVIIGVGAVFVLYLGIGGGFGSAPQREAVVTVGDRSFDARDVLRVRERQEEEYRRVLGDGFDPAAASDFLDESAASTLLNMALLARQAEDMGLVVSDEEIRTYLRSMPGALDEDGRLDRELLTAYAERQFGSLRRFQEALRDELLARKAARLVTGSVAISDAEALDSLRYQREQVSLALVRIDTAGSDEDAEVSDADVARMLAEQPERIREAYEARRAEFDRPEEVRARHILVQVPQDAEEQALAEARARAEELLRRIREGADFADVALETSDDPGSRDRGGDLGFFPRGRMVKPFEDLAFQLEPGRVSDVFQTVHGFHLLRVEEKRPAAVVPFEEAREQIARDLVRQEAARTAARERAERLATAVREGQGLVEAAREQGLSIQRPEPLRRRPDGYVPGVGAAPEVMAAAFGLSPERASDPRIHEVDDAFVLIQLLERSTPADEELAPLVADERQRLLLERRAAVETAWTQAAREELVARGEVRFDLGALRR